ncbi:MAG: putative polysaccharide biosynthesis protein [Sarcina sp.]
MNKQSLIKGSLILGVAGIIAKFLGLFFRWPIIMLIGDEGLGYYQLVYPLYGFFIAIATGIPIALSKIISENNVLGREKENFTVMNVAMKLMFVLSISTSFLMIFFGKDIIRLFNWPEEAYYSMLGISLAPMFIAIINPVRGFFQGYQNMTPSAISQLIEQLGRVAVGVGMAFLLIPYGIDAAAGGASFGAAAGAFLASLYLFYKYRKERVKHKFVKIKSKANLKKLLAMAIPISIGAAVVSVMGMIDAILVPKKLLEAGFTAQEATILFSQFTGKAAALVHIPLTLSVALCASIIPIIAEKYLIHNKEELNQKISMAMKMSFVIAIPCCLGLFFLAEPIMLTIFPGKEGGANILRYLSLSIPFMTLTQISTSILQAVGSYIKPIVNMFIAVIIKIVLTVVLVPIESLNVQGAVIATIASYVVVSILNIVAMKLKLRYKTDLKEVLWKPILAAIIMMIGTLTLFLFLLERMESIVLNCVISISIGGVIYIILVLVLGIFDYQYFKGKVENKIKK